MNNKNLQNIITAAGSDKETYHEYSRFYSPFFEKLRNEPISILEIGIDRGHSIVALHDFFQNANIYGIDINLPPLNAKAHTLNRVQLFKIDQTDKETLNKQFLNIEFDIIIDDGSHIPEHQILTFNHLFNNKLKQKGLYICEDLHTNLYSKQKYSMLLQLLYKDTKGTSLFQANDINEYSLDVKQVSHLFIYKNLHIDPAKDTSISSIIFKK